MRHLTAKGFEEGAEAEWQHPRVPIHKGILLPGRGMEVEDAFSKAESCQD